MDKAVDSTTRGGRGADLVALILAAYRRYRSGRTSAGALAQETAAPLGSDLRIKIVRQPKTAGDRA